MRERAAKIPGEEALRGSRIWRESAEVLERECRKGELIFGQSTRHESEVAD